MNAGEAAPDLTKRKTNLIDAKGHLHIPAVALGLEVKIHQKEGTLPCPTHHPVRGPGLLGQEAPPKAKLPLNWWLGKCL